MGIQIVHGEDNDPVRIQTLCRALTQGFNNPELLSFKVVGPVKHKTAILLERPIETDVITVNYVLTVESIYIFTVMEQDIVKGWILSFPEEGKMYVWNNGVLYLTRDFESVRRSHAKLIKEVPNSDLRKIDVNVVLGQNMFSIMKSPNNSVLLVVRDNTYVMTQ